MYKLWANHGTALVTARVGQDMSRLRNGSKCGGKALAVYLLEAFRPSTDLKCSEAVEAPHLQVTHSCCFAQNTTNIQKKKWNSTVNSRVVFFLRAKNHVLVRVSSSRLLNHGMLRLPTTKTWRTSVSSGAQAGPRTQCWKNGGKTNQHLDPSGKLLHM